MKFSLIAFITTVIIIGWVIGFYNLPGEWYAALLKPPFNPPNWIFGPVWTFLYVLIAIAGWRTWQKEGMTRPFILWLLQMGLNFLWSPTFFSCHRMDTALVIMITLIISVSLFIITRWKRDRFSAYLFIPYLGWVCFAGLLNLSLIWLN